MPAMKETPVRISDAVERLRLKGHEHVLEIGCGHGIAAELVCRALTKGQLVAIDRSPVAIEAAARRCEAHIATGKLQLVETRLETFCPANQCFDKALAINVNLFWLKAAPGLAVLRRALKPSGMLLLAYEPPSGAVRAKIGPLIAANLVAGGFCVDEIAGGDMGGSLLTVLARCA